jgi:membrane-associated protease RseP (regulator of RpoE activity)
VGRGRDRGSPLLDQPSTPLPPVPDTPWLRERPGEPALTLTRFAPSFTPVASRGRPMINLVLLLVTIASTTFMGAFHYDGFVSDFAVSPAQGLPPLWPGLWYSATILAILGCHELGHYYACRYYRVDASLPYFLPAPFLTGTLGAFIRIREPIPTKRMLFDIGVAGPIAGFVVAVPALFLGLSLSNLLLLPEDFVGFSLGEPLLFRLAAWMTWGTAPEGYSLNLHPMAFAAWFGLLATALNLFPIGQLDGGHISYAALGANSTRLTVAAAATVVLLTFRSPSWIAWAVLMVFMLIKFGPRHPQTLDHHIPLDRRRLLIAVGALVMFILCFTPAPIEFTDGVVQ